MGKARFYQRQHKFTCKTAPSRLTAITVLSLGAQEPTLCTCLDGQPRASARCQPSSPVPFCPVPVPARSASLGRSPGAFPIPPLIFPGARLKSFVTSLASLPFVSLQAALSPEVQLLLQTRLWGLPNSSIGCPKARGVRQGGMGAKRGEGDGQKRHRSRQHRGTAPWGAGQSSSLRPFISLLRTRSSQRLKGSAP